MPNPPRTAQFVVVPGDHAKPIRGAQLFFCDLGSRNVITPGTSAGALNFWYRDTTGTVRYSYRRPILNVRFGRNRKSSFTYVAWKRYPAGIPPVTPTLRCPTASGL